MMHVHARPSQPSRRRGPARARIGALATAAALCAVVAGCGGQEAVSAGDVVGAASDGSVGDASAGADDATIGADDGAQGGQDRAALAADASGGGDGADDAAAGGDAVMDVGVDGDGEASDAGATGCAAAADGAPCDDGDQCTKGDSCAGGVCVPGAALQCTGNACTTASCDAAKGCVFVDLAGPCDDGTVCTSDDTCQNGLCIGKVVLCDDGNACSQDSCDPKTGCISTPEPDDVPCAAGSVCYKGACVATGTIFAHTSSQLYRLELKSKSFVLVGAFSFDKKAGQVTDIALDRNDALYAITFNDLFTCKTLTAACTWLMALPQSFNGMTFVPTGTIFPDRDALIGISNAGGWYLIDFVGAAPIVKQLGSYGAGYGSSGDAFSVKGVGTFATVTKSGSAGDLLVEVDPKTGKVVKEVGGTGVGGLWGVAWWQGVAYGFSSGGAIYALDLGNGKASALSGFTLPSASWWGAGVSTEAAL